MRLAWWFSLRNSTFEQCEVVWKAVEPAIRLHDATDIAALVASYPEAESREDFILHAIKIAAAAGVGGSIMDEIVYSLRTVAAKGIAAAKLAQAAARSGIASVALSWYQLAVVACRQVRDPIEECVVTGELAAAAYVMGNV